MNQLSNFSIFARLKSKRELRDYFGAMLANAELGVLPPHQAADVLQLLERHPEYETKAGTGIARIEVRLTEFKRRGFFIVRIDGSDTDFSYRTCVDGKKPAHSAQVRRALRSAIMPQLIDALDNAERLEDGRFLCAATGSPIDLNCQHVDHIPPQRFRDLVTAWLMERSISEDTIGLSASADNQITPRLSDAGLERDWQDFHRSHARLRVVSKEFNQAQG